jgi:hypothetical protein
MHLVCIQVVSPGAIRYLTGRASYRGTYELESATGVPQGVPINAQYRSRTAFEFEQPRIQVRLYLPLP